MNCPKRYDMKAEYADYDQIVVKQLESEFGQWVTYSSYEELLNQFDRLEKDGLGYWIMDEFILIEGSDL